MNGGIDIKNRIKYLRESKLLTQENLEKITGIPQTKISRIESDTEFNRTRLWQLEKIASALDVEIIELFDLSSTNESSLLSTLNYLNTILKENN